MLDFTVMLALTSSSRALTAANSYQTEKGAHPHVYINYLEFTNALLIQMQLFRL